jgi:hypothetical protein
MEEGPWPLRSHRRHHHRRQCLRCVQHFTFIAMVEPVIGQVKALLP